MWAVAAGPGQRGLAPGRAGLWWVRLLLVAGAACSDRRGRAGSGRVRPGRRAGLPPLRGLLRPWVHAFMLILSNAFILILSTGQQGIADTVIDLVGAIGRAVLAHLL